MAGDTTDGCLPSKMVPSQSSQEMETVSQSEADQLQQSDCSQGVSLYVISVTPRGNYFCCGWNFGKFTIVDSRFIQ